MANRIYDIAIIGGGASGLMLAANLDLATGTGIILEGSSKLGSKVLMSGGGRCNITHAGSIKDFLSAYGDSGTKLRKILYKHNNLELIDWFESHGVPLVEESGRIFPASMKAKDILDALTAEAAHNLWQIETNAKVSSLKRSSRNDSKAENDVLDLWEIEVEGIGVISAANIVIASGGITYPETGSDGSMLEILHNLGVAIKTPRSALAPIQVKDYPYSELSGISIQNATVTVFDSDAACTCKGKAARMTGDLLFTHEGFSGPVILNISKYARSGELIRISYNKDFSEMPRRMQRLLENRCKGPSGDLRTTALASLIDRDDFTVSGIDPHGMVSSGGVSLDEISLSSMKLERLTNQNVCNDAASAVYIIGEAIDADGITGGYNLQLCWSTANTAADSLKASLLES